MVIYFSGTGNSEYVAKAIASKLDDMAVSANPFIREKKSGTFESEKPFVFVFPVYLSTSPTVFRDFIKSCTFQGSKDAYFVPTCAGADGSVPNSSIDLCRETGYFNYKGCKKINMPQNYIILFKPSTKEHKEECYENAKSLVDDICATIKSGGELDEKPASGIEYFFTKLVEKWYNASFTKTKYFRAGDACTGCGACAKLCPTDSIEMKDNKPVWTNKVCIHCMACISRCPNKAIEFGKLSKDKERHVCPQYEQENRGEN